MSHHYFVHYFPVTACLAVYFLHKLGEIDTEKENEYLDTKEKLQKHYPWADQLHLGHKEKLCKIFLQNKTENSLLTVESRSFKKKTPHTRLNAY